jgi:uroporphyrinogen-III synthase
VDLTAERGTGESLARELASRLEGAGPKRVVVAAAERASRHLEDALEPAGHDVVRVAVYRTVPAPPRPTRVDLESLGVDTILLASPSAVEGLLHQAVVSTERTSIISIGPSTTEAARAAGLEVTGEADRPTLEGLLEAIEK